MLIENLDLAEEVNENLLEALQERDVRTDTTCTDCELNDEIIIKGYIEMYMWFCADCGECFKYQEEECCNQFCSGAEHRVQKFKPQ